VSIFFSSQEGIHAEVGVSMSTRHHLVVFSLDGQRYALSLKSVDRVIHIVEMITIPDGSGIVLGLVNIQGQVIPVLDLRRRLGLPGKEVELSDHLIIAHTSRWKMALVVDSVHEVIERSEQEILAAEKIFPGLEHIGGVVKLEDEVILIHDLEKSISINEEKALAEALKKKGEA
jgi:purine-binding chemotaxis protein CheW